MKLYYLALLSILYFSCSCTPINRFFGIQDDNVAEEIVEEMIQAKAGANIDLSPGSPEK